MFAESCKSIDLVKYVVYEMHNNCFELFVCCRVFFIVVLNYSSNFSTIFPFTVVVHTIESATD